jgi:hypothetical protein
MVDDPNFKAHRKQTIELPVTRLAAPLAPFLCSSTITDYENARIRVSLSDSQLLCNACVGDRDCRILCGRVTVSFDVSDY